MKKVVFIFLLLLSQVLCAQPMVQKVQTIGKTDDRNPLNSIGVVCTYDYTRSLTDRKTPYNSATDTTLKYLYLSADSSSFAISEVETLEDLLVSMGKWKDLLVLVHGYGDGIGRLANREPLLVDMYNLDVLVFCWPACIEVGTRGQNYRATKDSMFAALPQFYTFLEELGSYVRAHNIHCSLMFHSLGSRFAMLLGQDLSQDLSFVDNIILNQACVPSEDYLQWAEPLSQAISGRLYITYNRNDVVLSVARSFSEHRPLLGQGPTRKTPFTPRPNIHYIDFTKILRLQDPHFSHNFYVRHPQPPQVATALTTRYRQALR